MEYEVKLACDNWHTDYINAQLSRVCKIDAQYQTTCVNSVYFDTPGWDFAMDKAASDYLKTKVRVRWYSTQENKTQAGPRFLEIKHKIGSRRTKHRIKLSAEFDDFHADHFTTMQLSQIREQVVAMEPTLQHFKLVPALYVSYHRRRFIEPFSNTRISLDSHICGQALNNNSSVGQLPVELNQSVVEVKGQESSLPIALRTPLSGLTQKEAFSKYYLSFEKLHFYRQ